MQQPHHPLCITISLGMGIENQTEPVPSEPIVWDRQPNSLTVLLTVLCVVAHVRTFLVSSSDYSKHGNEAEAF